MEVLGLSECDYPSVFHKELLSYPYGLIVVTGNPASGKATLTASLIHEINLTQHKRILITGSSVEFAHKKDIKSIISYFGYDKKNENFLDIAEYILKSDYDVVQVDIIDSVEMLLSCMKLIEHGVLVITTMNSTTVEDAIEELLYLVEYDKRSFIAKKLSKVIKAVITQTLIPKIGGGKVVVNDLMLEHPTLSTLIKSNNLMSINPSIRTLEKSTSMISQTTMIIEALKSNTITEENAYKYSNDIDELKQVMEVL